MHLFDDASYRDPDYAAAADWIADLTSGQITELPAGANGANFCPIANALSMVFSADAWDASALYGTSAERTKYIESHGGSSELFTVDRNLIEWPATYGEEPADDGGEPDEPPIYGDTWGLPENGGEWWVPVTAVPTDVARFVARYDAGDFPSLHLED